MDMTWREERPLAITAASQRDERPYRLMVTMASALSSSKDATMRFKRSLCGTALRAFGTLLVFGAALRALGLADFLVAGFGDEALTAFLVFFAGVAFLVRVVSPAAKWNLAWALGCP